MDPWWNPSYVHKLHQHPNCCANPPGSSFGLLLWPSSRSLLSHLLFCVVVATPMQHGGPGRGPRAPSGADQARGGGAIHLPRLGRGKNSRPAKRQTRNDDGTLSRAKQWPKADAMYCCSAIRVEACCHCAAELTLICSVAPSLSLFFVLPDCSDSRLQVSRGSASRPTAGFAAPIQVGDTHRTVTTQACHSPLACMRRAPHCAVRPCFRFLRSTIASLRSARACCL